MVKKWGEVIMQLRNAIGIDPESTGCVCALVKIGQEKIIWKSYHATDSGMKSLINWIKKEDDVIVAIEGSNGQSIPIEKILKRGCYFLFIQAQ